MQHQTFFFPVGSSADISLKSHARATRKPPAKAWPLMAAMVTRGKVRRRMRKGLNVSG
jgi:hypothetical protein